MTSSAKERRSYKRGNFPYKVKFRILPANEYQLSKEECVQNAVQETKQFKLDTSLADNRNIVVPHDNSTMNFLIRLDEKLDQIIHLLSNERDLEELTEQGFGIDISAAGMRIDTDTPIEPGQIIVANVVLFKRPFNSLDVVGEVVTVTKTGEAGNAVYSAGIQFLELNEYDKEKIIQSVFQRERESLRNKSSREMDEELNVKIAISKGSEK